MLLHPLLGLPQVCRVDYGAEGVTFKLLVSSENIKSLGCLIHIVLLELGSRRGDEAALPLRVSPGWYRQHFYPWQREAHIPEKTVPACRGNILIICVCCF